MIDPTSRVPTAAVVWIPPESVWGPIQNIRRRYDRHLTRWMPHMTLLYPFRPREKFNEIEAMLREAAAKVPAFEATLGEPSSFEHNPRSFTMWMSPEPAESFRSLQAALQAAVPDCNDVANYPGGFTPHLSVGQSHGAEEVEARLRGIRSEWTPLQCPVSEVAMIYRIGEGPFQVDRLIPLG